MEFMARGLMENGTQVVVLNEIVGEANLRNDEEGNKRLYVPAVIAIKDGKIVGFDDETAWDTKGYETPDEYWENEDLAALKEKLRCMMRDCEKSICTSSCNK